MPYYADFGTKRIDKKGYVKENIIESEKIFPAHFIELKFPTKDGQNGLDIVPQVITTEVSHPFKVLYGRPPMLKQKLSVNVKEIFKHKVTYNHKNAASKVRPMIQITDDPYRALIDQSK